MIKIDFTRLITKEVLTNDKKHMGHVDGFDNLYVIVKNGLFNPRYYKIPREKVDSYQKGKYYSIFRSKIQKDSSRENILDISRIFRDESKNLDNQYVIA